MSDDFQNEEREARRQEILTRLNQRLKLASGDFLALDELIRIHSEDVLELERRIERLQHLSAEANEKAAAAEKKVMEANELARLATKFQKEQYAPLIRDLFEDPQKQLQEHIKKSTTRSVAFAALIAILTVIISVWWTRHETSAGSREVRAFQHAVSNALDSLVSATILADERLRNSFANLNAATADQMRDLRDSTLLPLRDVVGLVEESHKALTALERDERLVDDMAQKIREFRHGYNANSRNDIRLLYKMYLSDFSASHYTLYTRAMLSAGIAEKLIPHDLNDYRIWDEQLLHIYEGMKADIEEKVPMEKDVPESMRRFANYEQYNDATNYNGWYYSNPSRATTLWTLSAGISRLKGRVGARKP